MNQGNQGTPQQGGPNFAFGDPAGPGAALPGVQPVNGMTGAAAGFPAPGAFPNAGRFSNPGGFSNSAGSSNLGAMPAAQAPAQPGAPMTPAAAGSAEEVALKAADLTLRYAQDPVGLATEFAQLKSRYLAEHYQILPNAGDK